jgi:hypothetical protein
MRLNVIDKFEQINISLPVENHKAVIPTDCKHVVQIAYKIDQDRFLPIRPSSSSFAEYQCVDSSACFCPTCNEEYSISSAGVVTTTFPAGTLALSYLRYPQDEEGYLLIPDNEDLIEAATHYVLYKYWLTKDLQKEEGADRRAKDHLAMWSTLSKKCQSLNLPSISQLENLKSIRNRLVPRQNHFSSFFSNLSFPESLPN